MSLSITVLLLIIKEEIKCIRSFETLDLKLYLATFKNADRICHVIIDIITNLLQRSRDNYINQFC